MRHDIESAVEDAVDSLRSGLGNNLYSCCLYGSAVRGNHLEGHSDLNLLVVLNESTAAAHQAIAKTIDSRPNIDPFVLARDGMARTAAAFATKFASIQRHYRVLYGADPLADVRIPAPLARFLCEQAVRNLRLRLVYSFVTRRRHKSYGAFLTRNVSPLFTHLGEALRLEGVAIPQTFEERIAVFETQLGVNASMLHDLLRLKARRGKLSDAETTAWHRQLISLLDQTLAWIEARWSALTV